MQERFFAARAIENGIQETDCISGEEYLEQLALIQKAALEVLDYRAHFAQLPGPRSEQPFGDETVGILIDGSYARSHPAFGSRMQVHRATSGGPKSDLDIVPIVTRDAYPALLVKQLRQSLYEKGLDMQLDFFEDFQLTDPEEVLIKDKLRNTLRGRNSLITGAGLLIMHEDSPYLPRVISLIQRGRLPVLLNPSSTNLRLR